MTANMAAKSHCNHCIAWEKIICNICIYQQETDTFIGMIMLPQRIELIEAHNASQRTPLCTGKSSLLPWGFLSISV